MKGSALRPSSSFAAVANAVPFFKNVLNPAATSSRTRRCGPRERRISGRPCGWIRRWGRSTSAGRRTTLRTRTSEAPPKKLLPAATSTASLGIGAVRVAKPFEPFAVKVVCLPGIHHRQMEDNRPQFLSVVGYRGHPIHRNGQHELV